MPRSPTRPFAARSCCRRAPGRKSALRCSRKATRRRRRTEAGADIVGYEDLAARIKEGFMDFDVVIASPDAMRVVGQLGQILGPRGLMPNPKVGTVSPDVVQAVKNAKAGQVQYRTDKAGHHPVHDRPRVVHAGTIEDQSGRTDRGAEQGEAGRGEGRLSQEGESFVDDGRGCPRRPRVAGRSAGAAVNDLEGRPGAPWLGVGPSKTAGALLNRWSGPGFLTCPDF